jgi:hypothetical protein
MAKTVLTRTLLDPLTLPATAAPRQLAARAKTAGFEVIVTTVAETALVTVQGVHHERGGFMATWIPGHVGGRLYLNSRQALIVPISTLKAWITWGEFWLDV